MMNEILSKRRNGKVLAFIGTTPNIGTTVSSLAFAFRIAEITQLKVAYLCLNLKSSKIHKYFTYSSPHATLDELLPHLRNASMTEQILLNAMMTFDQEPSVSILLGNRQREMADYFSEEDISALIELAKESFDFVILDCSAYWDNAGSLCGLQLSDQIFIVTTNALSHFQEDANRWYKVLSERLELTTKKVNGIIVRQHKQYSGFSSQDIHKELQLHIVGEIFIPLSLYQSLDEGQLHRWLTQHHEGKGYLLGTAVNVFPQHADKFKARGSLKWTTRFFTIRKKMKVLKEV